MTAADLLRAHLQQRRELGETELVLAAIDPAQLLTLLRRAGVRAGEPSAIGEKAERSGLVPVPPALARVTASAPSTAATAMPPAGEAAAVVQLGGDLAELRAGALGCQRCGLAGTRRQVVFGEGNERARLMVVGEAPGVDEDRSGRPFVGRAGQLLDLLLASVGFPRESVYICNVLKCHPPGNRNPQPEEIEACSPFLRRQVELVAPEVILTVGTFPSQTLLDSQESISRLRRQAHSYQGTPLIATYHPAALLRNPGWIRPVWEDLQRLRRLIDGEAVRA